jgi:glycosyltransferase involved in cell wall biosynthesis
VLKYKDNKIILVFAIPNFNVGGAERVFLNILLNIDRSRFLIHLICGKKRGPLFKLIPNDITVHELGNERAILAFIPLLKVVNRIKPDIIFATLGFVISAGLIKPLISRNTKIVIRLGNTISAHLDEIKQTSKIKYYYYYILNYLVLLLSDFVIVQSNFMKEDLIKIFYFFKSSLDKIIKINNPIDSKFIFKQKLERNVFDNPIYNMLTDNKTNLKLISVGRFDWQKGYDRLIKAFKIVKNEIPDAILLIIAEGVMREDIEKLVKGYNLNDCVFLPGVIENPYPFISASDIFISSSRYEGFSNAILESLILKIPVVATDCPSGIREIIKQDRNGWLSNINNNSVKNLADNIIKASKNIRDIDMNKESDIIIENYGVKNISIEYENFFKDLKEM